MNQESTISPNKKQISLGRDYIGLSLIVFFALLVFCVFIGWHLHLSQQKTRNALLLSRLESVRQELNNSIENVASYMQFMGDRVLNNDKNDLYTINKLFQNSFSIDNKLRNFYAWTQLDWVDTHRNIIVSSQKGYISPPETVGDQFLLSVAEKNPWILQVGSTHYSADPDDYAYVPVSMTITDDEGNIVGSIISKILVERLERDLQSLVIDKGIRYLIVDQDNHLLIPTHINAADKLLIEHRIATLQINKTTQALASSLVYDNTEYEVIGNTNYPFRILLGYESKAATIEYKNDLLSYVYTAFGLTILLLIIFFIFRKRVILPVIFSLKDMVENETAIRVEKERFLSHILSKIPGFVYRHTIQGDVIKVLFVSEGCTKLTGYTPSDYYEGEIVKHTDVIHPDHIIHVTDFIKDNLRHKRAFEISYPIITALGEQKWVLNQGFPVEPLNNDTLIFEGMLTDISDLKKAEHAMSKTLQDLAASNEELSRFAHICSHDLKEPLRTTYSYIKLLQREIDTTLLNDRTTQYIEFIETSTLRIKQLIEDILLYSQIGIQQPEHSVVNLDMLVQEVLSSLGQVIKERNATINVENPLGILKGNYHQLSRLFQNIVSNALKFNTDAPVVAIRCINNGTSSTICVEDNGIGISEEFYSTVFQLFSRLNTKDEYPGSGMGLALCQKIIERHGGKIWIKSRVNYGTAVYFELPS